ncbi:unnamed protein product [Aureobasidium uvarum]|uniref:F-box domain-containing protein n=1 Tax=Aureobasidium uvarum TaxID=2773716 RepID=A0A9N8PW17_9PEZI|nr:unnamed protein product [Aureobasidium uvarum]
MFVVILKAAGLAKKARSSRTFLIHPEHQDPYFYDHANARSCIAPEAVFLKSTAESLVWINVPTKTSNRICSPAASDHSMMLLLPILFYICFLAVPAIANVEKTIFTAPDSTNFGDARPNLMDLQLDILSSKKLSVRTALPVIFPTEKHPRGLSSWYTLENLRPGQRYEAPALLQDLSSYAEERQNILLAGGSGDAGELTTAAKRSVLFLRVQSAANFYTTDKALMQQPPPVYVDIRLKLVILNHKPSILPTMQSVIQSPPRSFRGLPTELVLEILSYLAPDALISFGFAYYHLLVRHSLASLLSPITMTRLFYQARIHLRSRSSGPMSLPSEVNLQILRRLEPADALNYAMANYLELARQGIAPPLSQDTLCRLNRAIRRGRGSDSNT